MRYHIYIYIIYGEVEEGEEVELASKSRQSGPDFNNHLPGMDERNQQ